MVWPNSIAMDESRFHYLNLPHFGKDYLIAYAIAWIAGDPSKSGALTVVDINPKKIVSAHSYSQKVELKQKYRKGLSRRITDRLYETGINQDTSITACRFFSETGPQWRKSPKHKRRNLLYRLDEYCDVDYPKKKVVEIEGEEHSVHPKPVIYAHKSVGKYMNEAHPKLKLLIDKMKTLRNKYEVMNTIWSLDGCSLNNGIPGTIYVNPLLQNELYTKITVE